MSCGRWPFRELVGPESCLRDNMLVVVGRGEWDDDGVEMNGAADDLIRLDGAVSAAWTDYRRI